MHGQSNAISLRQIFNITLTVEIAYVTPDLDEDLALSATRPKLRRAPHVVPAPAASALATFIERAVLRPR
jgi:hypothetical protein